MKLGDVNVDNLTPGVIALEVRFYLASFFIMAESISEEKKIKGLHMFEIGLLIYYLVPGGA